MRRLLFFAAMCLMALSMNVQATRFAGQVATTSSGEVSSSPSEPAQQAASTPHKRSEVEVLYGYLKIFPNELGTFESEPLSVIAQINKQALHGYNNWRLPTNEELSLLRANDYLGDGQYMTKERPNGIVLLVTDGDDYATIQKARRVSLMAQGYVDLGLPSGTLWKKENEAGGYYSYSEAMSKFKDALPTKEQLEELKEKCTWTWNGSGYKVEGPNGNIIYLPADGERNCEGKVLHVGSSGEYGSGTSNGSGGSWYLTFGSALVLVSDWLGSCDGRSIRLVSK